MILDKDLIELLQELEHEQWMAWQKSLMKSENISDDRRKRWESYMIPYNELDDDVKEFDREWQKKQHDIMVDYIFDRITSII